jgi:hypothetical protein
MINLVYVYRRNLNMRGDQLTMGYFDNLNNRPLNKFKKILKIEKKNYRCVLLPMD